jgi:hypothetical protein
MRLQTKEDYKKEYTKCKEDPIYFISNYIKVVHPVRGLVPFNLYPFQKVIIDALEGNRFNILRKFRQAGCTTIAAAYSLWLCCFKSHQTIVILSVGDTESTEVLDRIKIMYDELPEWIKPKSTTINAHNLKLENNSHIKSRPSGKQSGRGLSGSLLIIDEAAFIEHIDTIWAAVYPIISTGGRAFVLSTVNGIGNWYYDTWERAVTGANAFNPIQIGWQDHPEYARVEGFEWLYEEMEKRDPPMDIDDWEPTTRANISHKKWLQEYECEFLGTGDTFIEGMILQSLTENISDDFYRKYNNRMYVWKDPDPNSTYFMAVDVALGRGRDYSAFQIIDLYSGEQVAEFYSNTTPINEFARICFDEGTYYNLCPILVERNTIGNNLLDYLFDQLEYENVWFDEKRQMGLQITAKNRDNVLVEMEEAIRMNEVKINSKRTVMELNTFIISDNGKVKADTGQNDDLVMSLALSIYGGRRYREDNPEIIKFNPQKEKKPPMPLKSHKMLTSLGSSEEDITWLIK